MVLEGLKVVEFAGLAPGPFAGLILADNGASVIRVDRPGGTSSDILCRHKRSLAVNPKTPSGLSLLKKLITDADILIDPFRPGVLERLGLGPDVFLGHNGLNPRLIYARVVGFPRTGPHKDMAGHDINYLALSGVLSMLPGPGHKPSFPLNILADFAGGGLACALGISLAVVDRHKHGRGRVVNTDMVSGARYLSSFPLLHALRANSPLFSFERGYNLLDGGAPFYDIYVCQDGGWVSVGCLEPQFFAVFIKNLSHALPDDFSVASGWKPSPESQMDRASWPQLRDYITKAFSSNTRDHWARVFHGTDACVLPVLTVKEAADLSGTEVPTAHPEISSRAAKNSRENTAGILPAGQDTEEILSEMGISEEERAKLLREGAISDILHTKL